MCQHISFRLRLAGVKEKRRKREGTTDRERLHISNAYTHNNALLSVSNVIGAG